MKSKGQSISNRGNSICKGSCLQRSIYGQGSWENASQHTRMQRAEGGDGKGQSAERGVRAPGVYVTIDLCHIIRPVVSVM